MARIRSLKPEFCSSESIAVLSIPCRLHFAMLWTYCDDNGRGVDNPRLIKAALWPLDDDVTLGVVEDLQSELAAHGRIFRYEHDGKRYFEAANFSEHQHPNRKTKCVIPEPTRLDKDRSIEGAVCPHCKSTADALPTQGGLTPVVEGRGGVSQPAVLDQPDSEPSCPQASTDPVAESESPDPVVKTISDAKRGLRGKAVNPRFKNGAAS